VQSFRMESRAAVRAPAHPVSFAQCWDSSRSLCGQGLHYPTASHLSRRAARVGSSRKRRLKAQLVVEPDVAAGGDVDELDPLDSPPDAGFVSDFVSVFVSVFFSDFDSAAGAASPLDELLFDA